MCKRGTLTTVRAGVEVCQAVAPVLLLLGSFLSYTTMTGVITAASIFDGLGRCFVAS
jgi:hypothetical protein